MPLKMQTDQERTYRSDGVREEFKCSFPCHFPRLLGRGELVVQNGGKDRLCAQANPGSNSSFRVLEVRLGQTA